jgi:hypothetical protein
VDVDWTELRTWTESSTSATTSTTTSTSTTTTRGPQAGSGEPSHTSSYLWNGALSPSRSPGSPLAGTGFRE